MKAKLTHFGAALALTMMLPFATPAVAGGITFDAEIDCGGNVMPGDTVPFAVRFENQTFNSIPLDVSVAITVPGLGQFTLGAGSFTLGPNQDLSFTKQINLPNSAPNGSYQMSVAADSPDEFSFDTCSFNVI